MNDGLLEIKTWAHIVLLNKTNAPITLSEKSGDWALARHLNLYYLKFPINCPTPGHEWMVKRVTI